MGKKKCELCDGVARMFCESDQASLCWDCDGKVHGANFLVAKHALSSLQRVSISDALGSLGASFRSNGEEEAENQVVPWDAAPAMSSSSSVSSGEEIFSGDGGLVVKRTRRDLDLDCSASTSSSSSTLVLKPLRKEDILAVDSLINPDMIKSLLFIANNSELSLVPFVLLFPYML
ncbi:hypothetical protein Bca52824_035802 [Brassica carinata]|uniref:B box-type domain-containing protein n=1 Tax=Brassica carinata TaxID=52824 RepID=A0A8X7S3I3_BRACI|nr:hypothetical protein Bca52824_035802 [Brassica carinata]